MSVLFKNIVPFMFDKPLNNMVFVNNYHRIALHDAVVFLLFNFKLYAYGMSQERAI